VGQIEPEELLERLREGGGRITLQRRVIVETFLAQPEHVTAEELITKVQARYPEVNAATVYRTLEALDEICALKRLALGKGPVLAKQHGFHADIGHLAVTGRCAACAAGDPIAVAPHTH
jgi:Fe2+ or Zn2+ uptake regulation protein